MRKKIVIDEKGNEIEEIIDDVDDRRRCRNTDADLVGYWHDSEIDYDDIGHKVITKGKTLKIETTPRGQELYSKTVSVGDTVYWGIKRAK